ncbi:MAG: DMT family transporter [Candidatus Sungbacteria bacterium]|uniref:DMT family transporter n=1 Tax=Candidatus Sungiibacteriota bacterium TaxID=2750080 RepID=A0A9D6LQL8_9BACT|nr:DMT family transporter [Candidatus Sungbacteria bacterium]
MNWLFVALLSQFLLGLAAVFDRVILKRGVFNPWSYAFWLGLLGLFALVLIPFGNVVIPISLIGTALAAGALFCLGLLLLYFALHHSEASISLPIIAGFSALSALLFSSYLLHIPVGQGESFGFWFLVFGGLVLFFIEERGMRVRMILLTTFSALLLGFSQVLTKYVYLHSTFIAGFVWVKIGGVLLALLAFLIPQFRQKLQSEKGAEIKTESAYYLANRLVAGIGSFLFSFAVFLAHPALVESVQGFQYVIIFIFGALLLHEKFRGRVLWGKILAIAFIFSGLLVFGLSAYSGTLKKNPDRPIVWGLTFSTAFTDQLGLDWRSSYIAILDELQPKRLRLVAYWDEIEPKENKFDFSRLDILMHEAEKRNLPVILAVGMKLPRWPECHLPGWVENLSTGEKEAKLQPFIAEVVRHYVASPSLYLWQVENEPFLPFGTCPSRPGGFLDNEIALVRSIDPAHQILISDAGETGDWIRAASRGDVFGTTMYRKVYSRILGPFFGVTEYPIGPGAFLLKEKFVKYFTGKPDERYLVIELQAEPWQHLSIPETPIKTQINNFTPAYFQEVISYAQAAGFDEYYLWGAEWWYYMKTKHARPEYWNMAGELFNQSAL